MQCLYVAGTLTECRLRRGVCLQEVSVSRGLTVFNLVVMSIGLQSKNLNRCCSNH